MKPELAALISEALEQLVSDGVLAEVPSRRPRSIAQRSSHGDLSCNIAMVLAKRAGMAPRELASKLIAALPDNALVDRCDIAGPGFINFINPGHHTEVVRTILESGAAYGRTDTAAGGGCRWNLCPPIQQAPPRGPRAGRSHWRLAGQIAGSHGLVRTTRVLLQRRRPADQ